MEVGNDQEFYASVAIIGGIVLLGTLLSSVLGFWIWSLNNRSKAREIMSNILRTKRENGIHKTHGKF